MNAINRLNRRVQAFCLLLLCLLLTGVLGVSAQAAPTPISIGENQVGTLSDANGSVQYSLSVATPQSVEIQVLAITSGFAPTFVVLDPSGGVVLDVGNPGSQPIAHGTPDLLNPGGYIIDTSSVNGTTGQFLISVQAGEPLALPLTLGENQLGTLSDASSIVRYGLTVAAPQSVNLQVLAITPGFLPAFRVLGADDSVLIDVANGNGQNIARGIVDLPAAYTYTVEVRSANNTSGQYLISPQPSAPLPTATPTGITVPTSTMTPEPGDTCRATSSSGQAINVRSGPGTGYNVVGSLAAGVSAPVIGRLANNSWLQIDRGNGSVGWVSATVVTLTGDCDGVEIVVPPAPPPTQLPSPTLPPNPTQPSEPGSLTATTPPNASPTPSLTPTSRFPPINPNSLTQMFSSDLPDYIVDGLSVGGGLTIEGPAYVNVGVVVRNINPRPEHPQSIVVTMCIHVPGEYCDTYTTSLLGGISGIVLFSVPSEIHGVYQVTAIVDSDNAINESNEDNNSATRVLDIIPPTPAF